MSLKIRLALLFTVGSAAVLAGGGLLFVHELSAGLRASLVSTIQAQANLAGQDLSGRSSQHGKVQEQPSSQGGVRSGASGDTGQDVQRAAQFPPPPSINQGGYVTQVIDQTGRVLEASNASSSVSLLTSTERRAAQHNAVLLRRRVPGTRAPVLLLAQQVPDDPGAVFVTGASLRTLDNTIGRVETALFVGGPIGVLLAGMAAWLLAGAALSPVTHLRLQASEISARDEETRLAVPSTRDEIAALATTLNSLIDRLQGALSRQRGFVAAAGHELRTPLAILRGELELAGRQGRSRGELVAAVSAAAGETDRLIRLSEDLLLLARSDEGRPVVKLELRDLAAVLARSAEALAPSARSHGVALVLHAPGSVPVFLDEDRFRQVIDNLLGNALRFAPTGSAITVEVIARTDEVVVDVLDEGPGFPTEFLPLAFERFSRLEASRDREHGGAGLGLAIVKALVEAHHGQVTVTNRREGGACVSIRLPAKRAM